MGKGEESVREITHAWEKMLWNIRDMRQNITHRMDMVKIMRSRMTDPRSFSKHVLESSLKFGLFYLVLCGSSVVAKSSEINVQ